jgi:hypothetical protein
VKPGYADRLTTLAARSFARGPSPYPFVLPRARSLASVASPAPERLAASPCYGGDEANLLAALERRVDAAALAHVRPVDVDVHERSQSAALVEDEVRDWKGAERRGDGVRFHLEAALSADLGGQHARQQDYRQVAASTERIGGSWDAASLQLSPPSEVTKTEPL